MAISTNGTVLARVAGALYNTQMSNATYKEVAAMDPASLVNALYARDFSSATDATVATTLVTNLGLTSVAGLTNWVAAQLTAAGSNKGAKVVDLLNGFAQLTADATYGAAATAFNTKVDAALALSQTDGNKGGTFAAVGTAPVAAATFTLTTGADTFTGTAGDDTFNALISGTATIQTATSGDVLAGGTGSDTLNFTVVDAANPGLLQTDSIETVNVRGLAATTVDTLLYSGVTALNSSGSSATVTVNNGALAATYGLKSTVSGQAAGLTVNFRGVDVAGAADTAKVEISGVGSSVLEAGNTSPTVTTPVVTMGTGVEGVAVAAAGTNFVKLSAPATATKLAISGAGTNTVTVDGFATTVTIDASASTGTNTISMGTGLTTGDAFVGGSGTDTVRAVTTGTQSNLTMSGVETFRFDASSAGTVAFASNPGLTTIDNRSSTAVAVTGVTTLSNLKLSGDSSLTFNGSFGGVTLNTAFAGTTDSLAVTIGNNGNTTSAGYSTGDLVASGIETLNIAQSDMLASQTTTVGKISNTGMKSLTITTPGSFALSAASNISTKASSAPGATGTASTTGSNTLATVDLSGIAGGSGTITFEDGTFAAAATVKSAAQGGTYNFGSESATDVITFIGATTAGAATVNVNAVSSGTTASGTYIVSFANASNNSFDGSKLAAASTGNTVTITSGSGSDTLTGGANADNINGGAGADVITGGKGADVLVGGTGADEYKFALGTAAVNASAETQTITVAVSNASADAASYVISGGTLSAPVQVSFAASAAASTDAITIRDALNAVSGGKFVATASSGVVTVTYATAQGNVPSLGFQLYNSTVAAATVASQGTSSSSLTLAVTDGTSSAASAASDSAASSLTTDQVTYVSTDGDIISVIGTNIALHASVATTTTAAGMNSAGLISFASMTSNIPTSLSAAVTLTEAAVAVGGLTAGNAAAFVYGGQAYLFITDATSGVSDTDVLVTLTGITTLSSGITITSNKITAIS